MTLDEFDAVVERRLTKIRQTLVVKGREYSRNGDRLSNFANGAALLRCTPERALLGYAAKQMVSVVDFVRDLDAGMERTEAEWDEKLGDVINYLVLLEAVVVDRRNGNPPVKVPGESAIGQAEEKS